MNPLISLIIVAALILGVFLISKMTSSFKIRQSREDQERNERIEAIRKQYHPQIEDRTRQEFVVNASVSEEDLVFVPEDIIGKEVTNLKIRDDDRIALYVDDLMIGTIQKDRSEEMTDLMMSGYKFGGKVIDVKERSHGAIVIVEGVLE